MGSESISECYSKKKTAWKSADDKVTFFPRLV